MADANRVIATTGILTVGVGTVNSIAKNKTLPSTRFLIGSGAAFLILSAMAEVEPEVAKALSIAVLVTVVLGEGDGVLSYINGKGETDTQRKKGAKTPAHPQEPPTAVHAVRGEYAGPVPAQPDNLPPFPGLVRTG